MRFYTTDHGRLMMERQVGRGNSIAVEIERVVYGKIVQNEAAYRDYAEEIAAYKASLAAKPGYEITGISDIPLPTKAKKPRKKKK